MQYLDLEGANKYLNKFAENTNEKFKIHESQLNEHEDRIKRIDSNVASHLNRIEKLEEENVRLKTHVTFIYIMFIIVALFVLLSDVLSAKAATIDMRDESLGGFSYMMDCLEKNDIPEDYAKILRMWHPVYTVTEEEYEALCRIVHAEVGSGDKIQKENVASCVMARVESPKWPNDILGVIFDHKGDTWQFSPLKDGNYYKVKITQSTREAVDEVLKFGKTHDCLWFCSDSSYKKKNEKGEYCSYHRLNHTWVFFDGEHHYFYD